MKYEYEVDLDNENSSQTMAVEMVGGNKRVLEFGCAAGAVSKVLAERGCHVVGIELDPELASRAKEFCEEVIVADAEELDFDEALGGRSFDVAVFGDVLEHLRDPVPLLQRVRPFLAPEGYVVASIPNVAHGAVRLALLKGRFRYTPEGLLDETHLRFFTHDSVRRLFEESGFQLVETRRTSVPIFGSEIELHPEDFPAELVAEIEADPEATTYQFVTKAVVDNGLSAVGELHRREESQRVELLQKDTQLAALQAEADGLRQALDDERAAHAAKEKEAAGLRAQLADTNSNLEEVRVALHHAQADLERIGRRWPVRLYRALGRLRP